MCEAKKITSLKAKTKFKRSRKKRLGRDGKTQEFHHTFTYEIFSFYEKLIVR